MQLRLRSDRLLVAADGREFPCRIGRAGLAAPGAKREGDLMTPYGVFAPRACYYRPDRMPKPGCSLPVVALAPEMGWCDDPAAPEYNRRIVLPATVRHERLWREDGVYDLVIPLGYNDGVDAPIIPGAGSAIFVHLMREDGEGTEGCIALRREDLLALLPALDSNSRFDTRIQL